MRPQHQHSALRVLLPGGELLICPLIYWTTRRKANAQATMYSCFALILKLVDIRSGTIRGATHVLATETRRSLRGVVLINLAKKLPRRPRAKAREARLVDEGGVVAIFWLN